MRRVFKGLLVFGAAALVLAPAQARADAFVIPFIGTTFSAPEVSSATNGKVLFGGALGGVGGGGIFGFDIDFGYTPSFFGSESTVLASNSLLTTTANLIVGPSIESRGGRGVRPYATFGVGLIHDKVGDTSDNKFGWDAAGGLMAFFSGNLGIRGDVRFFHSVNNSDVASTIQLKPGSLHFWRAYVGLIIR